MGCSTPVTRNSVLVWIPGKLPIQVKMIHFFYLVLMLLLVVTCSAWTILTCLICLHLLTVSINLWAL